MQASDQMGMKRHVPHEEDGLHALATMPEAIGAEELVAKEIWTHTSPHAASLRRGTALVYPFVRDKLWFS